MQRIDAHVFPGESEPFGAELLASPRAQRYTGLDRGGNVQMDGLSAHAETCLDKNALDTAQ